MANADPFARVEEQFEQLRADLSSGKKTRQEVEAALKDLMVKDAQGQYWVLGPDSGKWYVHTEGSWVNRDPRATTVSTSPQSRKSSLPIFAGIAVLLIAFCIILGTVASALNLVNRLTALQRTDMPAPTEILSAAASPVTVPGVNNTVPTLSSTGVPPSAVTKPSPSQVAPIPTSATLQTAATLKLQPGPTQETLQIYIRGVQADSIHLGRSEVFNVNFFNTSGQAQPLRWAIYIFKDKVIHIGYDILPTMIQPGESQQRFQTKPFSGIVKGCNSFPIIAFWYDENNNRHSLMTPDKEPFQQSVSVCP